MSHETELQAFLARHAPDKRQTVLQLFLEGERLQGYSASTWDQAIAAFARTHRLIDDVERLEAAPRRVAVGRTYHYLKPTGEEVANELLYAELVEVYKQEQDRCLVQRQSDGYVAWVAKHVLSHQDYQPSHKLCVPRAHLYDQPKVSAARLLELSLGLGLLVAGQEGDWATIRLMDGQQGFVRNRLLIPQEQQPEAQAQHILHMAENFLQTPYVWGGSTAWGIDCSGLVQTVYAWHGITLPRDSDQQEQQGRAVKLAQAQKGDLLFFPGHVGIYYADGQMIHANARHMRVTIDPIHSVGSPRSIRRVL